MLAIIVFLGLTIPYSILTQNVPLKIITTNGTIGGINYKTAKGNVARAFLGVPYAQSPVGKLRFEYPLEPIPWTGTYDATSLKSFCFQEGQIKSAEDCLYLNIYAPQKDSKEYPVLVWIHGGSFLGGGANWFHVDGVIDNLVSRGMIAVFINYRLGFLGFASTLDKNLPGNYGLEDQLMALRWVKGNIKPFGGNPNAVTIGGESAGAGSVSLLGISPKSRNYFQRIIIKSGSALTHWAMRNMGTKNNTIAALGRLNCPNDQFVIKCLQTKEISLLQDVSDAFSDQHITAFLEAPYDYEMLLGFELYTPVKDDYRNGDSLLPDYPSNLMEKNAHLPIMIGTTSGEWVFFVNKIFTYLNEYARHDVAQFVPLSHYKNAEKVKSMVDKWYGITKKKRNYTSLAESLAEISSSVVITYPTVVESRLYAKKGLPVYAYIFDHSNDKIKSYYYIKDVRHIPRIQYLQFYYM